MSKELKKTKVHLFTGFLGVGKTTALKSLITQKPVSERWAIIVNEFGEIGIDGAVLSGAKVPVLEIAGGCLCCVAGVQMTVTVAKILRQERPDRLLIETSGLAHAASVIDELMAKPLGDALEMGVVFTIVDPRQFVAMNDARQPLYQDQIGIADVLVASKIDLCAADTLHAFRQGAGKLFPAKALVIETVQAKLDIAWLDIETLPKSRYRLKELPASQVDYQSQGFTFAAKCHFDGEKLTRFFDELSSLCTGLVRAKGVFRVLDTWVWLNWVDNQWGANQVSWRRDSRFEMIAKSFDVQKIEQRLLACFE